MTDNKHQPLGAFMDLLSAEIRSRMGNEPAREAAHQRIFGNTALEAPQASGERPQRQPACRHLPACFAELETIGGNLGKLGAALREIEPHLNWNNQSERRKSADLAENYADSFIVGRAVSSRAVKSRSECRSWRRTRHIQIIGIRRKSFTLSCLKGNGGRMPRRGMNPGSAGSSTIHLTSFMPCARTPSRFLPFGAFPSTIRRIHKATYWNLLLAAVQIGRCSVGSR